MDEGVRWLSAQEQQWWRAYLRATRELDLALDRDLQCLGLSLSEYELLSMLSEAEGARLRMSALAALIVQSRSRVTHTAARLERRGWVRRSPAPDDGRGVLLELTEQGRDALEGFAVAHVASVRRHLVDVLTPQQLRGLGEAMQAVRDAYAQDPTTPAEPAGPC
ncbi:MarR family transcriptional regulator [Phycicoccus endophyticus]|uniref:MarR family transcriptional regulator n=1 Tax=Phycicoccus endophyticus TaxID=1690220 RepID=A0A7G9QZJ6_9MICO|nr:MarR family transcriptional regulator [Phycicoccus endophyticus]NHI19137.1 MarR family transcriptional regulator [Phycicoccus endophyticus]QNN48771.1 MarR family transcriptional regulator [Phycicoccus endophyticus]GGL33028.1 MarR family transcriptional regulator [Phycicoccus endophyticus]